MQPRVSFAPAFTSYHSRRLRVCSRRRFRLGLQSSGSVVASGDGLRNSTRVPWGVVYTSPYGYAPVDRVSRHPTQFYELAGDLVIAAIRRLRHRYQQTCLDGALYEKQPAGCRRSVGHNRIITTVVQPSSIGVRPLECASGGRRSCEAQTGATRVKGDHPDSVAPHRPQAVAEKTQCVAMTLNDRM